MSASENELPTPLNEHTRALPREECRLLAGTTQYSAAIVDPQNEQACILADCIVGLEGMR